MLVKFLTSGSTKAHPEEIDYESHRYTSYVKEILIPQSQLESKENIFSLFTKSKGRHILGRGIKSAAALHNCSLVQNDDLQDFVKKLISSRCDYLFCTPSFLWNFKNYIDLKKIKKIQLAGEYVSPKLREIFLNDKDESQIIINHYGTSETFGIGYCQLHEDFKVIKNGTLRKDGNSFYFSSPYTAYGEETLLSDILLIEKNSFKILGRNNLEFVKKNGKKIDLSKLRDSLFSLPIISLSFEHITSKEFFEDFNLYVISTSVGEDYIRKFIYDKFDANYQPRKIFFMSLFEKTKNDIKFKLF
jgi:hypothetical protein